MLSILLALALGQSAPDARGESHQPAPVYNGHTAAAPIPPDQHVKNEGGSDGAGLCVIASITANGAYQGVQDLATPGPGGFGHGSKLWKTAKSRPGGYYPEKLKKLVDEVYPGEGYGTFYGSDTAVLERFSKQGYPLGVTMNTGARYDYQPIAHMVSLIDYRDGLACVVDNNFPGEYTWMPRSEFDRRFIDRTGNGWAWVWKKKPGGSPLSLPGGVQGLAVIAVIGAAALVVWGASR